jgi:hypothetical protein
MGRKRGATSCLQTDRLGRLGPLPALELVQEVLTLVRRSPDPVYEDQLVSVFDLTPAGAGR